MASKGSSSNSTPDPNADPTQPEIPEQGAADPAAGGAADGTTSTSQDSGGASPDQDEAPTEPQVVSDETGTKVLMPDGSVVVTRVNNLPVSNSEQAQYELTHTGDQPRYAFKPGDKEYNPLSDPAVPNSHMAQHIGQEIVSFAERVVQDPKAVISPMWNSLKGIFDEELDTAIKTGVDSGKVKA